MIETIETHKPELLILGTKKSIGQCFSAGSDSGGQISGTTLLFRFARPIATIPFLAFFFLLGLDGDSGIQAFQRTLRVGLNRIK